MTDDTISRQAAIEALKRAEAITRAFGYHHVIKTVRELPSAQPERKEGRWKNIEDDSWADGGYTKCSACGWGYSWGAYFEPDQWDFCPKCGAKMKEE